MTPSEPPAHESDAIRQPPALAAARTLVERAVNERACPAAAVEVGSWGGPCWREAFGTLTWDEDTPAATVGTVFDLASLTKVIVTTSLAMHAVERGSIDLDAQLAEWLPLWRGADRERVTLRDLLQHASGLPSHLPFFRDCKGRAEFEPAICSLPLDYEPRSQAVYSDLGFILLGFVLEDRAGTDLATAFRRAFPSLHHAALAFRPSGAFRAAAAPTRISDWRGRLCAGEVDDDNAHALGGVAGHSGLFGTAKGVGIFARAVLRVLRDHSLGGFPGPATLREFARRSEVPGSSRALGWDTMLPTSSCGTRMRPTAIGHTGFTGTSLWIDWESDMYAVLLTNRVHPSGENDALRTLRPVFHDAVMAAWQCDGASRSTRWP